MTAGDGLRLAAWGPEVFAEDRRALGRLASAAARTLEAQRLNTEPNAQLLVDFEGGAGKDKIALGYTPGDVAMGDVILQENLQHH